MTREFNHGTMKGSVNGLNLSIADYQLKTMLDENCLLLLALSLLLDRDYLSFFQSKLKVHKNSAVKGM